MDASSDQVEYLSSTLLKSRTPVTYHTLTRELKIHQNNAKNILHEFYSANRDKILASFIITGKNKNRTLIRLCKDESNLESDVKLFEDIHGIHVYSLQTKELQMNYESIVVEELKYTVDHAKRDEYFKIGMIKGPNLVVVDLKRALPVQTKAAAVKQSVVSSSSGNDAANKVPKSTGLTSGYVSRKATNDNRSSDRSKTESISNYTSRKSGASNKPAKRSVTAPTTGYQYKSRKLEKQQPKERVIISHEENHDNNDDEIHEKREEKKNTSDLNNLFIDDFSDESDQEQRDVEKEEPIVVDEKNKKSQSSKNSKQTASTPTPTAETVEPVKIEQDAVDDDGYMTSFKSNNPVKNKQDKKKTQSSLMNFFKPK